MTLNEFGNLVEDALDELAKVRVASAPAQFPSGPSDFREVISIVRTAASEIILCSSLDEAIDRLKQDQLKLAIVEYVARSERSNREIESAIKRAYEKDIPDTPALPCVALCSYLIELCDALEPGKAPDAPAP